MLRNDVLVIGLHSFSQYMKPCLSIFTATGSFKPFASHSIGFSATRAFLRHVLVMKGTGGQPRRGKVIEKEAVSHGSVAGSAMLKGGVESWEPCLQCTESKDKLPF